MSGGVQFKPIELPRDEAVCVRFKREAYVCSFGDDARFYEHYGTERGYLRWLRERMQALPPGGLHVWSEGEIVGQLEVAIRAAPASAYVNLICLASQVRGTGVGERVHRDLCSLLRARGVRVAELNVAPGNARAFRYYRKHGWVDLGPEPGQPEVHRLRLQLIQPGAGDGGAGRQARAGAGKGAGPGARRGFRG